jgi:glycosyltransferase involved in cell wall biosynthesis
MDRHLRIAQVAPPFERVPPVAYGGTERIVHGLVLELERRGHAITTFASGDSDVPGTLVPTVPAALRPQGYTGDPLPYMQSTVHAVLRQADGFDLIHSHLEWLSLLLARLTATPVVSTFHGRLDLPWADELFRDPPAGLVAISRSQASAHPDVPWAGIVHNGLDLDHAPFERRRSDALCFVGRVAAEKGIVEALEIAKAAGRPLRIAAKVAPSGAERAFHEEVFAPALAKAGRSVEFLGEVSQADRDQLFAESYASLMPGSWPEPFGLVAIEALACGTPVIAKRVGALPEIIRDGIDGFFGDDVTAMAFQLERVDTLDRAAISASVRDRFGVGRMTDGYEAVYASVLGDDRAAADTAAGEITILPLPRSTGLEGRLTGSGSPVHPALDQPDGEAVATNGSSGDGSAAAIGMGRR